MGEVIETMESSPLKELLTKTPLVITGMGAFSAGGDSVSQLWQAAVAGQSLALRAKFQAEEIEEYFSVCRAPE